MQPLTAAPVPTYASAYKSLGSVYDPQVKQVNTQIAQLAPQEQAQLSALDQAKANAFRDIGAQANSRGMLFSGFTPDQEAVYTGTKYLPAVAQTRATFQNSRNSLLDTINKLNAARAADARDYVTKGQQAYNDALYKNAQLGLAQQRLAISAARASSGGSGGLTAYQSYQIGRNNAADAAKVAAQYKVVGKGFGTSKTSAAGGYSFVGPNGRPVSMAEYVDGSGAGGQGVIDLLSNGSSYDRWVLQNAAKDKNFQKAVKSEDYGLLTKTIAKHDKGGYYGF